MPLKLSSLNVDLMADTASISISGEMEPNKHGSVNVYVPIKTPGNKSEQDLKKIAREAAKAAIQEALRVLEER